MKMFNTRLIHHGLPPVPKIINFDTYSIAKKYFKFNSNRLDYLARFLGYRGKLPNPRGLWIKCFNGHIPSLQHMARYNRWDIRLLEFVYKKMSPFVQGHQLNRGVFKKGIRCPNCGSEKVIWRGTRATTVGWYRQFSCKSCGRWSNERKAIKSDVVLK